MTCFDPPNGLRGWGEEIGATKVVARNQSTIQGSPEEVLLRSLREPGTSNIIYYLLGLPGTRHAATAQREKNDG